jgi:hypothetical protein
LLVATCANPPKGRARWTLELLADAMVKLTGHDSLSSETVRRRLAENGLKPWRKDMWCIPKIDGEYVARMEDVLDLYAEAPDPDRPVVCFDERPVQLEEAVAAFYSGCFLAATVMLGVAAEVEFLRLIDVANKNIGKAGRRVCNKQHIGRINDFYAAAPRILDCFYKYRLFVTNDPGKACCVNNGAGCRATSDVRHDPFGIANSYASPSYQRALHQVPSGF